MGGFNPRKVEQMELVIQDLSDFAQHLVKVRQTDDSNSVKEAIKVIRAELKKMKKEDRRK